MPLNHILSKCTGATNFINRRKNQPHNVNGHQIPCKKWKRIENSTTGSDDIQPRYKDGIFHRKMCYAKIKSEKRQMTEGIELPNQEKIRTIGEKEIYKYLGILEAGTKQADMKEKKF